MKPVVSQRDPKPLASALIVEISYQGAGSVESEQGRLPVRLFLLGVLGANAGCINMKRSPRVYRDSVQQRRSSEKAGSA